MSPPTATIYTGDVLDVLPGLPEASVHCVVTSPPYWGLRDYGVDGQIGAEKTPVGYTQKLVVVFREVWRVLRDDGVLFLNMGDSYAQKGGHQQSAQEVQAEQAKGWFGNEQGRYPTRATPSGRAANTAVSGLKPKDLCGIPWRLALALQADGWYLRQDIIWHKPGPMPGSHRDRCTSAHEYLFHLTKMPRYFYDQEAIKEPAVTCPGLRIKRSVWTIATQSFKAAHFAVFPEKLVEPCVLAGTSVKGCCPSCGTPWKRAVKKTRRATRPGERSKAYKTPDGWDTSVGDGGYGAFHKQGREKGTIDYENRHARGIVNRLHHPKAVGKRDPQRHVTESRTVGWKPGCTCGIQTVVPGVVLDPFAGAGTVALVAAKHGCSSVSIELNPEYVTMIQNRLRPLVDSRSFKHRRARGLTVNTREVA